MAAGVGSRFGGIKQLEPVGPSGEIILDYSIFDALSAGFSRVVFVIRKELEADFRDRIGRSVEDLVDTRYVFQELDRLPPGFEVPTGRVKPWGTGHAILCCRDDVDSPFAVVNADDFYGASAYEGLAEALQRESPSHDVERYCMAGYQLGRTLSDHGHVSRGVCSVADDATLEEVRELLRVLRSGERIVSVEADGREIAIAPDTVVSMNMWGFRPSVFDAIESRFIAFLERRIEDIKAELYIPSVVMELIEEGTVKVDVIPTDERWVGVTYREDLPMVRAAIAALVDGGTYPVDVRGALARGQSRAR
jgi:dTDP-glucose pyrophosphorylase